jgi:hypothetical protein
MDGTHRKEVEEETMSQTPMASKAKSGAVGSRESSRSVAEIPSQKLSVNLTDALNAMRARFIAVGLFMSVLMINWRQVTDTMEKIWKVRGKVNVTPFPGRRFIL